MAAAGAGLDLAGLRAELLAVGDPERAAGQQRYMKSELPYFGVRTPELRRLLRPYLEAFVPASREEWESTVRLVWDTATHREEWYVAIAVARHPAAAAWQDRDALDLYRHLIVTGAWWDVVDEIAQHLVGGALLRHREAVTPILLAWAVDDDLWLRRAAVICQLDHGVDVDLDLLTFAIESNLTDRSFWLRKAIGWALRQYARVDPGWVRHYVDSLGGQLSGLSRREATRRL